jgi:hypothetical protein
MHLKFVKSANMIFNKIFLKINKGMKNAKFYVDSKFVEMGSK